MSPNDEGEMIRGFLTDRVQPVIEEVFDAYVIVGIDPGGNRRLFYHVKPNDIGNCLAMEIAPILASGIFFVEEHDNSSPQPGGGA